MTNLLTKTLPLNILHLLEDINKNNLTFLENFYLSAGTALSLIIGHRESEDLDFFTSKKFDPLTIQNEVAKLGKLKNSELSEGTLNTYLNDVKLQFLYYPYKNIRPFIIWNNVKISSKEDIACTKLITISMRGSKKDFIDLYFLLKEFDLNKMFEMLEEKYTDTSYNKLHILKSLTYFDDAELQPMPRMQKNISWEQIKNYITTEVKKFVV